MLIDQKIHPLIVKVPRQLYLNLKGQDLPDVDIEGCAVEKVTHTLPNGHPSVHLFRLSMSEETYVKEAPKLTCLFNHPSVEGVYEKQLPLTVRAVLQLGSSCTVDETQKGVLGKGLGQGFDLSALQRTGAQKPYLSDPGIAYIYLYHLVAGERQIFAVFSTVKDEATIIVLDRSKDAQGLPSLERTYGDLLARRHQERGESQEQSFDYQERIHFTVCQLTNKRKAYLELGDSLKKMRSDESRPTILVVQSPRRRLLTNDVPILRDFPVLPLKFETSDSNLPPLGWQSFVVKRLITHYLSLASWVDHLVELARYGDIPLCNLERDDVRYLIDIAYARRLQRSNVVLWWSGGPLPDHAGYQKDDVPGLMETVQTPAVNNPGTYSSVCIELDVRNLSINTILTSSLINELEGSDSVAFNPAISSVEDPDGASGVLYSENAFASAGIAVLREMVKSWWTEACKGSNMADIMVQHLVRWVEHADSFLYDRSLHYYVQMMSRKAFQQLMTDFKRVGSHIVFANTNRLLLQTTKAEVGNAYAYSQYILKSIKAKPLFHFLDLEIKEYWDYLVWSDEYNYGGKACQEVVDAETQTLDTIMHWQLNTFLPKQYQTVFHDWVVKFIELMHQLKHPRQSISNGDVQISDTTARSTQLPVRNVASQDNETEDFVGDEILSKSVSKPMKRQVLSLISRHRAEIAHPSLAADHSYPLLPGSHLHLDTTHPVLQLVKSIMHVLSLDRTVQIEARLLRKELLAFFEIKEFSPQARFLNPSSSLRLEQLICESCTMARDLDLCRDEDILPLPQYPHQNNASVPAQRAWTCPICQHEYNRLMVEERLLARVHKMITEWQIQDLKCAKCRKLRVNDFMEHCGCGGIWVGTVDREAVLKNLKVLERVAESYGLRMLGGVVDEVLTSI